MRKLSLALLMPFRANKVVKNLVKVNLAFWSGWGFVSPLLAVFIIERIHGGSAAVVGIAVAIYWLTRSTLRIPIGLFLDDNNGEEDDYWFLFFGAVLVSVVFFGYMMATLPWHVYFLQSVFSLGMVLYEAGMVAIFTRHIDKGKESTEWGIDSTIAGAGIGFAGGISGLLISKFGFEIIFVIGGIFTIISASLLFVLARVILPRDTEKHEGKNIFSKEKFYSQDLR
ncbi:MAG: MFS transporter [bacterium]